jgi:hypothetical protein
VGAHANADGAGPHQRLAAARRRGWTIVDTGLPHRASRALWERIAAEHLDGLPVEAWYARTSTTTMPALAGWISERFGVPLYMTLAEFLTCACSADACPTRRRPSSSEFYGAPGCPPSAPHACSRMLRATRSCRRGRASSGACAAATADDRRAALAGADRRGPFA